MTSNIIKAADQTTTDWSGGKTTELYIFPTGSDYKKKNFDFRLSTATVEIKESDFTPLPDVKRTLMVLEGEMELIHEGEHASVLGVLDSDQFEGGWKTKSKGTCVDFNLMTQGDSIGELKGLKTKKNERLEIELSAEVDGLFVYLFSGQMRTSVSGKNVRLFKGDLLVVNDIEEGELVLNSVQDAVYVVCQVKE